MNFKQKKEDELRKLESVYFSKKEKQDILNACKKDGRSFSDFCRFYALKRAEEINNGRAL
jgi:4-alpha-glucanotransferase